MDCGAWRSRPSPHIGKILSFNFHNRPVTTGLTGDDPVVRIVAVVPLQEFLFVLLAYQGFITGPGTTHPGLYKWTLGFPVHKLNICMYRFLVVKKSLSQSWWNTLPKRSLSIFVLSIKRSLFGQIRQPRITAQSLRSQQEIEWNRQSRFTTSEQTRWKTSHQVK